MRKRIWHDIYNRQTQRNYSRRKILLKPLSMKNMPRNLPEKVNPDYKYWNLNIHIPDHYLNTQNPHEHQQHQQHQHYNPLPSLKHDAKVSTSLVLPPWKNTRPSPDPLNPLLVPHINTHTRLP